MAYPKYPWQDWLKEHVGKDIYNWHILGYAGLLHNNSHYIYARCKCGHIQEHRLSRFINTPSKQCRKCFVLQEMEAKRFAANEAKKLYGYIYNDDKKLY